MERKYAFYIDVTCMNIELKTYLSGAATFLAASTQVNATVIYTNIDPDTVISASYPDWGEYSLDLNNDSISELHFTINIDPYSGGTYSYYEKISGGKASMVFSHNYSVTTFNYSSVIDSNLNFSYIGWRIFTSALTISNFNDLNGEYAAIRFSINGGLHYGWIRFASGDNWIKIFDYAYESVANAPIKAGQKTGGVNGITSNLANQFNLISNDKTLTIETTELNYDLTITDLTGKNIFNSNNNNGSQTFSIVQKGIFLATLTKDEELHTEKIIIK